MQVKKFEARSMKEALEMIKTQLGPDAIILSAKEITKGFGLGGEKSIEITAAYSESTLQKKKFVESKLPEPTKDKFQKISAKSQREVMQKMIESQIAKINAQTLSNPYSGGESLKSQGAKMSGAASTSGRLTTGGGNRTSHKITERRYIDIDNENNAEENSYHGHSGSAGQNNRAVTEVAKKAWSDMEVSSLKEEIEVLKQVITQFKTVPQSFVHAHPGAEQGVHYKMSIHFQKLVQSGVQPEVAGQIILHCQKHFTSHQMPTTQIVESMIAKYMLENIKIAKDNGEQFHLFVGPSGTGKTSAMIKFASELMLNRKKRIALISTDNSKVGATEQMKIFAQILNVPFLAIRSQQDWAHVIPHLPNLDHVLVDFAGLNLRHQEEINYINRMSPSVFTSKRTHLVLSSLAKDADLIDCAKKYESIGYDDVIFSALDEATQHGNILNFSLTTGKSLFAFGIGPKVPEDFEFATAERIVDLILKITKNTKQEVTA